MEENTKDSCCINGKCLCHKKWVRISLVVASGLIIFLLGIALGSCHRGGGDRNFRGGNEQFGRGNSNCPMMQGGNRGLNTTPRARGTGMMNQNNVDQTNVQNVQATQKSPSSAKIQVVPVNQVAPTTTPTPTVNK